MHRSKAQKAQSMSLGKSSSKSNVPAPAVPMPDFEHQLSYTRERVAQLLSEIKRLNDSLTSKEKKLHAARKTVTRAKATIENLRQDQHKLTSSIKNRDSRKKVQNRKLIKGAKEGKGTVSVRLKEKGGVVSFTARAMVQCLVKEGVPEAKIDPVIHIVADGIGVEVPDHIDARSVGRIVAEGGVAAEIQIVDELRPENASGMSYLHRQLDMEALNL